MKWIWITGVIIMLFAIPAFANIQIDNSQSSEWEATGFNNGRRMVRDADGYFHVVFHSQEDPDMPPGGPCAIFYTHTLVPADGIIPNPPPWNPGHWAVPVALTYTDFDGIDDRYPSIAIEYDDIPAAPGFPKNNDRLHVVWQRESEAGNVYDIAYSTRPNEPAPPPDMIGWEQDPFAMPGWRWLYQSFVENRDSLVPAIAIGTDGNINVIHVVWQEEDFFTPDGVNYYSEILYKGSIWGNWNISVLFDDNISDPVDGILFADFSNSQMPSIATAQDIPPNYNYGFDVFVVWNDDYVDPVSPFPFPPHIWQNANFLGGMPGQWNIFNDVSGAAGTGEDGYPNIVVDFNGMDHIVYMSHVWQHDPDTTALGRDGYMPGLDPTLPFSFPGPDPRMYGVQMNVIRYASLMFGTFNQVDDFNPMWDNEFPTISADMGQLWVNWQRMDMFDYEIIEDMSPLPPMPWGPDMNVSMDMTCDDYFPNLAVKKLGMYLSGGRDMVWTKIMAGNGFDAAMMPMAKQIWFDGNSVYTDPSPPTPTPTPTATATQIATDTPEPTPTPTATEGPQAPEAEFGDAPDESYTAGQPGVWDAYLSIPGNQWAHFPSCYNTLYGISPFGSNHIDPSFCALSQFGSIPSIEVDVTDPIDPDIMPNLDVVGMVADFDDDGLSGPPDDGTTFQFNPDSITVFVNPPMPAYINYLVDLNQDGDWNEANEHVVIDFGPVGPGAFIIPVNYQGTSGECWVRVTSNISNLPWYGITLPWDGSVIMSFDHGETEDYLIDIPPEIPTATPTATATLVATNTPTNTVVPTSTPTATATLVATNTPTPTATEGPVVPFAEYGDAPDSTKALMTAYTSSGTMAAFPTQYISAFGVYSPFGAFHTDPAKLMYLSFPGFLPTLEQDADDMVTDQDGTGQLNIDPPLGIFYDNDSVSTGFDDGAQFTWSVPTSTVTVNVVGMPGFLNVLFDLNRDGDWFEATGSGEWVIQNMFVVPGPPIQIPVPHPGYGEMWIRVTLTEWPITHMSGNDWEGTAPLPAGWHHGETEDYFENILEPTGTPTSTPTGPTVTPTATPTSQPIPTAGPVGIGLLILLISGLLGVSSIRKKK